MARLRGPLRRHAASVTTRRARSIAKGIRALFLKEVGGGRLGLADGRIYPHISMQPVVTLAADGQSGKGRWHIMAMLGGYERSASWAGGVYENEYVRENGVWKFKDVRYLPQVLGPI